MLLGLTNRPEPGGRRRREVLLLRSTYRLTYSYGCRFACVPHAYTTTALTQQLSEWGPFWPSLWVFKRYG